MGKPIPDLTQEEFAEFGRLTLNERLTQDEAWNVS